MKTNNDLPELPYQNSPDFAAQPSPTSPVSTISPSIRLLFSQLPRRHVLALLFPAILSSIVTGAVAPFMTYVVGKAFAAFAVFPQGNPTHGDKAKLLQGVGLAALQLIALAVGAVTLSSLTSCLWIWTGERNVMALRKRVYDAVSMKDMAWFDTKMGAETNNQGTLGTGGLMAKFTRETDDVRTASSLASGQLLQCLTTCMTCLLLAFVRSWSLTLVILSAVPLLILIQSVSQTIAAPLLAAERSSTATAGTLIDRAVTSISTVKAFNAQPIELDNVSRTLNELFGTALQLNIVWGATGALTQFTTMAMFVQGFWFGAKLVKEGKVNPGDVMTVFWACLIATSNLQMCIPRIIALSKGKFAMVALLTLIADDAGHNTRSRFADVPLTPAAAKKYQPHHPLALRKIRPSTCAGELSLHNITFTYPTLASSSSPTLSGVSLYFPAGEMTFIVGASGSGKSTIAQLFLRSYLPDEGAVCLDETDMRFLDEKWMRECVIGVGQGWGVDVVLEGLDVRENVALGLEGVVSGVEVEEACRVALLHEFVRGLPEGYETVLGGGGSGSGGVALSGGQRQRLAIARAMLRNPPVLVLDEATSALDATSQLLVFEALKTWRKGKTTVVITHDLSQIGPDDFVYVMKSSKVVEQGFRCDLELEQECASFEGALVEDDDGRGEFRKMLDVQLGMGDFLPAKDLESSPLVASTGFDRKPIISENEVGAKYLKHQTILRPLTFGNWMFNPRENDGSDDSDDDEDFESEKYAVKRSGTLAHSRRAASRTARRAHLAFSEVSVVPRASEEQPATLSGPPSFWRTLRAAYSTIPRKPFLFFGLFICILSGAMTPLFSFLLSRLLFEVSTGAHNAGLINRYGGIVLGIAGLDGLLIGLKYFWMETTGMAWITSLRKRAFELVLRQDKSWFDASSGGGGVGLVGVMMKDGEDAKDLVSVVLGQCVVVGSMLGLGLVWAMVRGWELTLVGVGIAPVFVGVMGLQAKLVAGCEMRNKRAREAVAKGYYDAIVNVRGIRAMGFEGVFQKKFEKAANEALTTGIRGAFAEGCTYGVASGLIYLSEALLFYVGAVLVAKGTYTYLQMIEVLLLVVFTVTLGSQLMAFTHKIAKSTQATSDFNNLMKLSENTPSESKGSLRPRVLGPITFDHVNFSYPERPEVPVLKDFDMSVAPGECVAIVGPSGSGKSTVAALLQRLYEPDSGQITIGGGTNLGDVDVHHLRRQLAVVSQDPKLFDGSVTDNILYGSKGMMDGVSEVDVRSAAVCANIDEFVMGLPKGYDTGVGEDGGLLSGGQAQRVQIARALVRKEAEVLVLDECTSSLDVENQKVVLDAIKGRERKTMVVMVTHKVEVMRMCDRVVLVDKGEVKEEGTFDELVRRKGLFATLASAGEWVGS